MTIEMPEARILASQLDAAVRGRSVAGYALQNCEGLQRTGFISRDPAAFGRLVGRTVERVASRGNTIVWTLEQGAHLIVSPEYGGEVFLREAGDALPPRYHVRIDFGDGSAVTVWIKIMGGVHATDDAGLTAHYLIRRDFDPGHLEPDDPSLTLERFSGLLAEARRQLKPVLVGRDAVVLGLGNSLFQDVLFRAGLHPRRRASDLDAAERQALYEAIRLVVAERLRLGGKRSFLDLYGRPGGYEAAMGSQFRARRCPRCGTPIERLALGGGEVFVCPACQPEGST